MKSKQASPDANETYLISRWGAPYFDVNEKGNLDVTPNPSKKQSIDLKTLIDDLCRRGIQPPILIRFNDILDDRLHTIAGSFNKSIKDYGYQGKYTTVMPIKVNQQKHVVEELIKAGESTNFGLECGSKPELLATMGLLSKPGTLLVCNGYKDSDYINTALDAQLLGLQPFLVMDRFQELGQVIKIAKHRGLRPLIGIRAKLSAKGKGKWADSSGDRSKFGLSAGEIVQAVQMLKDENMLDCLRLLHFHIGSQITTIRAVKTATREAAHFYCNLHKMGCTSLTHVDVGGGLAVDYDGSKTNFHSSMNYSTQEYANDIISEIQEVCDEAKAPHPTILSESGRALVAHHAVLVFNVLGVNAVANDFKTPPAAPIDTDHGVLHAMWEAYGSVSKKRFQESYNDAVAAKEESVTLFSHGVIDLETKAKLDDLFWATCTKIQKVIANESYVPEDLEKLSKLMSDIYYCNFSVFQSIPDSWAVGHLFPICPIHRLNEDPTREGILADLTCDSDGKVDQFIGLRDVKNTLKLHEPNGEPYYLGAFLVGAYQEILGDLHNLFGDTNAVHVTLGEEGNYNLEHVVQGDTVQEVMSYVEYDHKELIHQVRKASEKAVKKGQITFEESAKIISRYKAGLSGYTYLVDT